ncbi:MAG: hypothetical protein IBX43_03995 [Campylobacterales bacterium]|nr:hypothetical protein [Campylobacterales bacterium]
MYKSIIFSIITVTLFSGCMNKRGISSKYYNNCREYYDASGYYHKTCDDNLIEFSELKEGTLKAYESAKAVITHEEHKEPKHKIVW